MNILIMGPAGSGKGTMSSRIVDAFGVAHISTGDMFREAVQQKTETGLIAKQYMDAGKLVPDEVTIRIVQERIAQPDCAQGYLLDGYPRTLNQALAFEKMTEQFQRPVDVVIHLVVEFAVLARRITGRRLCKNCGAIYHIENFPPLKPGICDRCGSPLVQRSDDTIEQLQVRIQEHQQNTEPVLDYYRQKGLVKDVDAGKDADTVWQKIAAILEDIP